MHVTENKKHKSKAFGVILASMCLAFAFLVGLASAGQSDFQTTLLNYYAQQLVAHGALLFASTAAAFTFINGFMPRKQPQIEKTDRRFIYPLVFVLISGILLGFVFYAGLRMMSYGLLAHGTIYFPTPLSEYENCTFGDFVNDVDVFTWRQNLTESIVPLNRTVGLRPYLRQFLENFVGGWGLSVYSNLLFCFYLGIFLAYCVYYAFADHKLGLAKGTIWFAVFLIPTVLGCYAILFTSYAGQSPFPMITFMWFIACISLLFVEYLLPADVKTKLRVWK